MVQSVSLVRAAALRNKALSLANTCSIGFQVGRVWRQEEGAGACHPDGLADTRYLVGAEVVHDDHVAGAAVRGRGTARHRPGNAGPFIGPSSTSGAMRPVLRKPATHVVVRQCPCGTASTRRSPRGDQPYRRTMFVLAPVSSMNTKQSESMKRCQVRHNRRCWATSGPSCSAALRLFFCVTA